MEGEIPSESMASMANKWRTTSVAATTTTQSALAQSQMAPVGWPTDVANQRQQQQQQEQAAFQYSLMLNQLNYQRNYLLERLLWPTAALAAASATAASLVSLRGSSTTGIVVGAEKKRKRRKRKRRRRNNKRLASLESLEPPSSSLSQRGDDERDDGEADGREPAAERHLQAAR